MKHLLIAAALAGGLSLGASIASAAPSGAPAIAAADHDASILERSARCYWLYGRRYCRWY